MKNLSLTNYNICFENDFSGFQKAVEPLNLQNVKIMVVFDSNTAHYYQESFVEFLKGLHFKPFSFLFEAGEKSKNLETVHCLYETLINHHFERKDVLIAFGGGVVGDLTGFVAATYLRGIRFLQIPTSLLAMADSSIGGKTGVDFQSYKNMVGSFYEPSLVYINLSLLNTLPDREYLSGMAEIIKAAYIKNKDLLQEIKKKAKLLVNRDYTMLQSILYEACKIKQKVVEADFKEAGERALLNFGHTVGHSLEKLLCFTYLHGECISLGMVAAAKISLHKSYLSEEDFKDMKDILTAFDLPTFLSQTEIGFSDQEVLEATKLDKKMEGGTIKFILLKEIGDAVIHKEVSDHEILIGIHEVLQ